MNKFILCAFVVISTLTSCSSNESEAAKTDNSFSHKIVEVRGYDSNGVYVDSGYDKAVNENSKIVYNQSDKTITINVSGTPQIFKITSIVDNVYTSSYKVPFAAGAPEVLLKVEISKRNGNIIFLVTKPDTTFYAKLEYVLAL